MLDVISRTIFPWQHGVSLVYARSSRATLSLSSFSFPAKNTRSGCYSSCSHGFLLLDGHDIASVNGLGLGFDAWALIQAFPFCERPR